jgi:hypothetical protein
MALARRGRIGRAGFWAVAAGLLAVVLGAFWAIRGRTGSGRRPSVVALTTPYRNARPGVAYVGDAVCARCHERIAESYGRHPMGRSLAAAGAVATPGLDAAGGRVEFAAQGLHYVVERRDGRIVHAEEKRDERGEVVARIEAAVGYVVGSGRRGRSFLIEREGGYLLQSPISWYAQQGRWDLSPDSQGRNNHFERPIDPNCLGCHANRFEPVEGTLNRYEEPVFRGMAIGCERCHGPGGLHVRDPLAGAEDPALIVNPARLEPTLREAVCEQCHLRGQARVERRDRAATEYRPGLPLHEFVAVFIDPDATGAGAFRSLGHVEQMHASRCYTASGGQLGCISCHDPHRLPEPGERVAYFRERCLSCHGEGTGCALPLPVRQERSREDSCIDCHMPRSPLANVAHTAETDHRIPRDQDRPSAGDPGGASDEPLVPFHAELRGVQERGGLDRDLGVALAGLAQERGGAAGTRLMAQALRLLDPALAARPEDVAAGRARALALLALRRPVEARKAVESALSFAPRSEGLLELALWLASRKGPNDEALALGRRLLAVDPWASAYHLAVAQVHARGRRWGEAAEACRATLRLDPTNLAARRLLIEAAVQLGDMPQARAEAQTYFGFDPPDGEEVRRRLDSTR